MGNIQSTAGGGIVSPSGYLYLGTLLSNLVNLTWTKVPLDTILTGFADGIEDTVNNRITPAVAGLYLLFGQVTFVSTVADKLYYVKITRGGSILQLIYNHASILNYLSVPFSLPVILSAAHYIDISVRSEAGDDSVSVLHGDEDTYLACQRVR